MMCNMTSGNQRTLSPLSPNVNDLVWLQSMTPRVVGSTLSLILTTSNLIIGGKYDSRRNCVLGKY